MCLIRTQVHCTVPIKISHYPLSIFFLLDPPLFKVIRSLNLPGVPESDTTSGRLTPPPPPSYHQREKDSLNDYSETFMKSKVKKTTLHIANVLKGLKLRKLVRYHADPTSYLNSMPTALTSRSYNVNSFVYQLTPAHAVHPNTIHPCTLTHPRTHRNTRPHHSPPTHLLLVCPRG